MIRRAAAVLIDAATGFALTIVLSSTVGMYFARRAVVTLHIGEPGTWWQGPIPLVLGAVGEVVYLLPFALWVVWMFDPLTGATVGKRAMGLRICASTGHPPTTRALWSRYAIQTVGLWGLTLALIVGRWEIGAVALCADVVVGLGGLHDRLTATRLCSPAETATNGDLS